MAQGKWCATRFHLGTTDTDYKVLVFYHRVGRQKKVPVDQQDQWLTVSSGVPQDFIWVHALKEIQVLGTLLCEKTKESSVRSLGLG